MSWQVGLSKHTMFPSLVQFQLILLLYLYIDNAYKYIERLHIFCTMIETPLSLFAGTQPPWCFGQSSKKSDIKQKMSCETGNFLTRNAEQLMELTTYDIQNFS